MPGMVEPDRGRRSAHRVLSVDGPTFYCAMPAGGQSAFHHSVPKAESLDCVPSSKLTRRKMERAYVLENVPFDFYVFNLFLLWHRIRSIHAVANACLQCTTGATTPSRRQAWTAACCTGRAGRVWGGSSSLNAMVYIRGTPRTMTAGTDRAPRTGTTLTACPTSARHSATSWVPAGTRGDQGPLHVSRGKTNHPLHRAFLEAAQQAGYPLTEDMNGFQQEGFGWMDMTIHKGQRWSAACAYLHPALSRPNLTAEARTFVSRVLFEGTRAVGVEYIKNGQSHRAYASNEVILSGGAINSPQLLMLSGVGNADDLKKLGIPVVCHLPGVGQNLQDHLEIYIQQACTRPITLHAAQKPLRKVRIGLEWLWKFTGDGATAHLETGGFIRSRPGVSHPDIQFHFLPSQVIDHGRVPTQEEAYQVHVGTMRGTSVGWLKLRSANPQDHPVLQPNYLSTEADIHDFRNCVKLTREIFAQEALAPFRGKELQPGSHVQSDKDIDAFVRAKADSAYHPSCTCKMGQPSDPTAVVDPQTRVIGVENLRVVDASIMPSVVSGNLNAPTIMIAEKAADIIRGRPALRDKDVPVYKPRTLATQR
ncbi:hypothetical protein QTO34_006963 [Cnephaeus nilssonii]|uniref:Glucose-methanol-choline oxidoreductase N-terminal domain-containing protein n=1 Tax=Cnephaeus nilssonii TaxID=3371016 RepID=A0AA40HJC1_CNENI|nr:hypothetical protein QTO34_006963 [Eptesicus nilssonii]